jgi:uncharacterized protein YbaP (TraB family)
MGGWLGACLLVVLGAAALLRAAAPPKTSPRPYLWRVERFGLTSYLFGTIHVGLDHEAALGPVGLAALAASRRVFVEMDLTSVDVVAEFTGAALRRAEMPPDRSLRDLLGDEAWRRLAALHAGRIAPAELERLEPWFVSLWTLPQVLTPRKPPGVRGDAPPLDLAIAARAGRRGARVSALESPAEHLATFAAIGRTQGVAMLEEVVADPEAMRAETDRLVVAYAGADDRAIRKLVGRLARRRPTVAEYLLFRRNERWCEKLERWLPEGRVFVVVGVGHMFGERGLVRLLQERGYRVERVQPFAPAAPGPQARRSSPAIQQPSPIVTTASAPSTTCHAAPSRADAPRSGSEMTSDSAAMPAIDPSPNAAR